MSKPSLRDIAFHQMPQIIGFAIADQEQPVLLVIDQQHWPHVWPVAVDPRTRQIKMGRMVYDYRRKHDSQASVPWLQLTRDWLDQAAFSIDTLGSVRVEGLEREDKTAK